MNMKNLLKKTFLLLALVGGAMNSWADNNPINLSQPLGSYIVIGTGGIASEGITLNKCSVDGSGTSYTIGSTKKDHSATFALYNSTARDYYFSFYSGSQNVATQVKFVLSNGTDYSVERTFDVTKTGAWTLTEFHDCWFNNVPSGNLTLTMTFDSESTDYMGNYGNFSFHYAEQWPTLPVKSVGEQSYVTTTASPFVAVYSGSITGGAEVSSIKDGGTAQYYLNNETAGRYLMHMGVKYYGTGTMTVTVIDLATGSVEVNQVFDVPGKSNLADYEFPFFADITTGVKIVKLVFNGSGNGSGYILNYGNIYFESYNVASRYEALPLKGTSTLTLNQSIMYSNGPSAGSANDLGSIRNGYYVDGYYVYNNNGEAYYNFCVNATNYKNGGIIKLTITDVATHTTEVDAEEFTKITANGAVSFKITNPITSGLKRIRLDFVNTEIDASAYFYNLSDVSFDPVTSVSATITPAGWCSFASSYPLDLSTLTASEGTATAYYASAADGSEVTLTPTTAKVEAGEGIMIKGTAGATVTIPVTTDDATFGETNFLKGQTTTGNVDASNKDDNGIYHYVFGYVTETPSTYGFYNLASTTSVPAGKAYLETTTELTPDLSARAITIVLADDILTGINQIDNGEVKSSLPVKRIVNGKLVIEKKGMMFNANGSRIY